MKYLLKINVKSDVVDDSGSTPLHVAVREGCIASVKCLLTAKADPKAKDNQGITPLDLAKQNTKLLKCLLDAIDDLNDKDELNGYTLLHSSAREGNLEIVEYLLTREMDPNVINNNGNTPLHIAARNGDLAIIKCLINHGANIKITNTQGYTAARFADLHRQNKAAQFIPNYYQELKAKRRIETQTTLSEISALKIQVSQLNKTVKNQQLLIAQMQALLIEKNLLSQPNSKEKNTGQSQIFFKP